MNTSVKALKIGVFRQNGGGKHSNLKAEEKPTKKQGFCAHTTITDAIICFVAAAFIWILFFRMQGYAPFGTKSLAVMDAFIQYEDFFMYLKDVLNGENNIAYTFSKGLGGTNVAVFSYYLSSPWNLSICFFEDTQIDAFFNLMVAWKLSLAAVTARIFLGERFSGFEKEKLRRLLAILISLGYAFCQYNLAQGSNIFWLDGVYILPLILLGVYRISVGKDGTLLAFSVAASILFNWYSGGINCVASILWIFWELACVRYCTCKETVSLKQLFVRLVRYGISMLEGVTMSAALFLPTVWALRKGSKGVLELAKHFDINFIGSIYSAAEGFSFNATSAYGRVALFCGSLTVVGIAALFISKKISNKEKFLIGSLLLADLLIFYWTPLVTVFSLLKSVTSYWYRYSYVGILILIFCAGYYYLKEREIDAWELIKGGCLAATIFLFACYASGNADIRHVHFTAFFMLIIAVLLAFIAYQKSSQPLHKGLWRRSFATVLLVLFVGTELIWSMCLQLDNVTQTSVEEYQDYVTQESEQVDAIKKADGEYYRISQTKTYGTGDRRTTANYNESMAYNYWGVATYTSSADDVQQTTWNKLGYRIEGSCISIVNTSIITADSLMGVRYVFSQDEINGYSLTDDTEYNGKKTFENPFALPMAFTYPDSEISIKEYENPFIYQNEIYSQLSGRELALYEAVPYTCTLDENGQPTFTLSLPQGNYAIYGNLPWNSQFDGVVSVNGAYETSYARWLSPSVFYIPTAAKDSAAVITVTSYNYVDLNYGGEQFYALNLDLLAEVSAPLIKNAAEYSIENGKAAITVNAKDNERLYISIPYDTGWEILLDGKYIEPDLVAELMYSIPLTAGRHEITMTYHVGGLKLGILASLLGVICTVGSLCIFRAKKDSTSYLK